MIPPGGTAGAPAAAASVGAHGAIARGLALAARHFAGRAMQRLRQGAPGIDPA